MLLHWKILKSLWDFLADFQQHAPLFLQLIKTSYCFGMVSWERSIRRVVVKICSAWELATLLEGAGLFFNISSAIFQKNIQIWTNKCVKLERKCVHLVLSVSTSVLINKRGQLASISVRKRLFKLKLCLNLVKDFNWEHCEQGHWSFEPQLRALVWPYPTLNGERT